MADIIKEQTWSETLEQKQSYEDLMKQLSELEKQIWGDWIIWNWDSVLDEEYKENLEYVIEDWDKLLDKIEMLKSMLELFTKNIDVRKIENNLYSLYGKKILWKFHWKEKEIGNYINSISKLEDNIRDSIANDSFNKIMLWWSINDVIIYVEESRTNYKISKIKKIIKEFNLSDEEVNNEVSNLYNIIWSDDFPKYSKANVDNGSFFKNKYTIEKEEVLDEIFKSLYWKAQSKFDENTINIINKKRNFAEIIKKDIDPLRMWLELQCNLDIELKEINQNNLTKDDVNKIRETKDNYFVALTKYLKEDDRARSIFLEKAEINNPSDNDIWFKDWLKIWLWDCDHLKNLLWEIRVVEMWRKVDKMIEKAKSLYNDEGLIQLKAKIIEKVKTDWKECVLDYVKFFVDFDKEAIEKWWANKLRKVDEKTNKIIPLNEKQVWIDLLEILRSDVDEYRNKLLNLLLKYNLESLDLKWKTDEDITKILKNKWVINKDINEILDLNSKINKTNSQVVVMTKFNSLSSENQTKFLSDFENAKKEWKEPSEAIKILDTYVQKNSEEVKQNILKSYPDAIISPSSNWWAEIKLWNTIIDLNSKELNIIWWNKEKLEKFIDFKKSLDDLGLWFLWKDREVLFQNIKNQKWENSINMLDDNVIWDQEFKNILDYIADKIDIPKKENLDEFKQDFLKIKSERLFNKIDYSKFDNDRVFSEIFRDKLLFEKNTETLRREI